MSDAGVTVSDIPAAGPPRAHQSSRLPGWIWLVGTIALLWVLIAGVEAALVAVHVHRGTAQVDEARRQLAPEDLKSGAALPALRRAGADFRAAHREASHPALLPVRLLPVLGRQLRAVIALTQAGDRVTVVGADTIREADAALSAPHADGAARLALLHRIAAVSMTAADRLRAVELGPSHGLLGPLASRRRRLGAGLERVVNAADRAAGATSAMADLLSGRRYLVLAANNAEMRAGSGMFLSVGVLESSAGAFHLGPVRPSADFDLPGDGVALGGTLAERWGWLHPNREWRNLGLSPQFDETGPLAARMWQAAQGQPIDGVLAVDVEALKTMLSVTGPVATDRGEVSAGNVEPLLFHDQYVGVTPDPSSSVVRRDRLGAIASNALTALQGGGVDLARLGHQLANASGGRHILAWAARPEIEAAWQRAGVGGTLEPNAAMVSVLNRGANKLDQFIRVAPALTRHRVGSDTQITLSVTMRNDVPPNEPPYVAGVGEAGVPPGTYLGLLAIDLPAAAGDVQLVPAGPASVAGPDGASQVVATRIELGPGQVVTVALTFRVAGRHRRLRIDPSARVPPVLWTTGRSTFTDLSPHDLTW